MKSLLLSTALLGILIPALSQTTGSNCTMGSIINVDGQAGEWPMEWLVDSDKSFSYNVCADDQNIYIRVKATDDMVKRKMGMFGFTVWMDPNGKKKRKLGLRYPTGTEAKERLQAAMAGNHEQRSSTERAEMQKRMLTAAISDVEIMELIGLTDDPLTSSKSGITNGIRLAIGIDSGGAYVYEAVIPFKSFRLSRPSIDDLGIGFETGRLETQPKSGGGPGGGGFGGGGYGGGGGGRRGGGGGGGRQGRQQSSGYSQMSTSTSSWVIINLK